MTLDVNPQIANNMVFISAPFRNDGNIPLMRGWLKTSRLSKFIPIDCENAID